MATAVATLVLAVATAAAGSSLSPPAGVVKTSITIDTAAVAGRTRPEYVSFNFEFGTGGAGGSSEGAAAAGLPRLEWLARQLAPSFLRVGGNSADVTVYALGRESNCKPHNNSGPPRAPGVGMPERCFTPDQMRATADFAKKAGTRVVFDVNEYYGYGSPGEDLGGGPRPQRPGPVNLTNAADLVAWWRDNPSDAPAYVTLGNELPNNLTPEVTATDFAAFSRLLYGNTTTEANERDGAHRTGAATSSALAAPPPAMPELLGTDAWWENTTWVRTLVAQPQLPRLGAFTFHLYLLGEDISAERLLDPTVLDSAAKFASNYNDALATSPSTKGLPLWITEAGAAWGGAIDTFGPSYIDGFWFLDQLGSLATRNVVVQHRHALAGSWGPCFIGTAPDYVPRPDFFTAVLWKRLVGTAALATTVAPTRGDPDASERLRVYAHCHATEPASRLTLVVVNLANHSWSAAVPGGEEGATVDVYWLTPSNATAGLLSHGVALNGRRMAVLGGVEGPWAMPDVDPDHMRLDVRGAVRVPPLGYGFVVVNARAPACV